MNRIHGKKFIDALLAADIIRPEDRVRRVVIDARVDSAVVMYVERFGDQRLLEIATTLEGVRITVVDELPGPPGVNG